MRRHRERERDLERQARDANGLALRMGDEVENLRVEADTLRHTIHQAGDVIADREQRIEELEKQLRESQTTVVYHENRLRLMEQRERRIERREAALNAKEELLSK